MNSQDMKNIGFLLNKTTQMLKSKLSRRLIEYDITVSQWAVLRDLDSQEKLPKDEQRRTAAHLAERLHSDRPTLSGVVERLTKKGLLVQELNPADRRSQLLGLTGEARELLPQLACLSDDVLLAALRGIEPAQLAQLSTLLVSVMMNLEDTQD